MEEYDDLATGPVGGSLNLSHNSWKKLPPELNDFSSTITHLELSNNQLSAIPEAIGNLILLQQLDVSLNQIESIDSAIGKCIRLRKLNVEKNRIEFFPDELADCIVLEEVLARDNKLNALPQGLEDLTVIAKIDVRNNNLLSIPFKLCRVVSYLVCVVSFLSNKHLQRTTLIIANAQSATLRRQPKTRRSSR